MADRTSIEWTDASWNPIRAAQRVLVGGDIVRTKTGWHCEKVSPGCAKCYAQAINRRLGTGLDYKPGLRGKVDIVSPEKALTEPLRWKRPRRVFVGSMTDLFADFVTDEMLDAVFAVMALCPQHTFQLLTKRPARMRDYLTCGETVPPLRREAVRRSMMNVWRSVHSIDGYDGKSPTWPLPNVWLGVSVEDQERADERIPELLATPAAVRWISAEPLLGPVDLDSAWHGETSLDAECWGDCAWCAKGYPPLHNCQQGKGDWEKGRSGLDWVVAGGESGPGARPLHPDWARSLRDQCAAAGVPFLFKQWGAWAPAPWKIVREPDEGPETYKARAERLGASHAVAHWGYLHQPDHKPWSVERAPSCGPDHAGVKLVGKTAAGRTLDGVVHDAFPEARP